MTSTLAIFPDANFEANNGGKKVESQNGLRLTLSPKGERPQIFSEIHFETKKAGKKVESENGLLPTLSPKGELPHFFPGSVFVWFCT